jgi:dihydrofolate synthase/folylpolyglutamate synthase
MTAPSGMERVLERFGTLHPKRIDVVDSNTLSLDRIGRLLAALGNPEDKLPPVVHVAGTNGKGSTIATLRACIEAADYRVHVYTSPHLVRFNERIRVAGELIEDEALIALLEECEQVNAGQPITFFEVTTCAAFLAFSRIHADIALLEVGLGGRLDTTNVVRRPAATAITPVSLDHQAFLGDTIAAIAGEKAGILKPGVPAIIGPQPDEAEAVIEARAAAIGAPLFRWQQEWRCDPHPPLAGASGPPAPAVRGRDKPGGRVSSLSRTAEQGIDGGTVKPLSRTAGEGARARSVRAGEGSGGMRFVGTRWRLDLPLPSLPGRHQLANAGAAIACLEQMPQFPLSPGTIAQGLRHIDWPARLQQLRHGPLIDMLLAGWELWLDGGHNPAAGGVLADAATGWDDRPLYLIVGMLKTKDAAGFLAPLAPRTQALYAVTIPGEENPHPAAEIAASARSVGIAAQEAGSIEAALREIVRHSGPARILICGSLHFAGVVLAENG